MEVTYQIPTVPPKSVFRTYDIRGPVADDSITEGLAYAIGLAYGQLVAEGNQKQVIVGRDGRLTSPELSKALIAGLNASGRDVIDIGTVPTPLVYFATNRLSTNCGVMVTASHNPGDHNGFKMVLNGKTVTTQGVQDLYQMIAAMHGEAPVEQTGNVTSHDIVPDYFDYITSSVKLDRAMKVVIDCGNGVAGGIAPQLFKAMGCDVIELFCDVDGHFPNHHPDPTIPENLVDIINAVKTNNADIGLAFDGDADRLGIVTSKGEIIWPDRQMMLFAKDILSRHPGADIIFDVKCSSNLPKTIAEAGGNPIMYRTGHSLIKNKMFETGAPFAGEMSGHIFFKERWFGFDDGLYVGARLLEILSKDKRSSAEIFAELPDSVNTPELKLPMDEAHKADFMQRLSQVDFGESERITIDGLRLDFGYGWGLIRPSNTSPYLIVRFEADTEDNLQQLKELFREKLTGLDATLQLPF